MNDINIVILAFQVKVHFIKKIEFMLKKKNIFNYNTLILK